MSLEAALEEERLEILKLLERPKINTSIKTGVPISLGPRSAPLMPRTTSPARGRPQPGTPMGGISSMMLAAERGSHSASPPPSASRSVRSRESSPHTTGHSNYRRASAGQSSRVGSFPSSSPTSSPMLGQAYAAPPTRRSGSPTVQHGSLHARSSSPSANNLPLSPLASPPLSMGLSSSMILNMLDQSDAGVDLDNAYRRLTDGTQRRSGGPQSQLPERGVSTSRSRANSGSSINREGGVRLAKDLSYDDGGREVAVESSEESDYSSDEDDSRGRSESNLVDGQRKSKTKSSRSGSSSEPSRTSPGGDRISAPPPRKPTNVLAAAEEERQNMSSRYQVSSLLPSVTVSTPSLTQFNTSKNYIHPNTNYDIHSHASTPFSSDTEENATDLKKAVRMALNISPIVSTPETSRLVRTITRGDFETLQQEVENGRRKQRSYLVATDLSAEAAHALEWTIGTVLRDGDTLLAIYAIDDEAVGDTGTLADPKGGRPSTANKETRVTAHQETHPEILDAGRPQSGNSTLAASTKMPTTPTISSPLTSQFSSAIRSSSTDVRDRRKAERERWAAAENITALVTKLLRKTRLQVNVVVEVIHCKSPKHLLTEMIDILEPTLVVLGSRGRSALKGVLLGSFSNYLVTKSSVPVMVARRKLKQSKYKKTNVRLSNNLTGNLASAKVD